MKPVDESVLLDTSGAVLRADEDDEGDGYTVSSNRTEMSLVVGGR